MSQKASKNDEKNINNMPHIGNETQGKFKKVLISKDRLPIEAKQIETELDSLEELYLHNKIQDWETVLLFLLIYLNSRVKKFAIQEKDGKKYQKIIENSAFLTETQTTKIEDLPHNLKELFINRNECTTIREYLLKTRFLKIKEEIKICLLEWSVRKYSLILEMVFKDPKEILRLQAEGKRIITLSFETARKGELLGNRDAFEFTLHDLSHAFTFFSPYYDSLGQIKFFRFLYRHLNLLAPYLKDLEFQEKWIYLSSDMNSHPEHLKSYFKAILKESKKK